MKWDKDQLLHLQEQLRRRLEQSIYRQASPDAPGRVDLLSSVMSDAVPTHFIKQLLSGPHAEVEAQINEESAKCFHHLYIEQTNQDKDKGCHQLGFGYPMFIHRKDEFQSRPIVAPFFIWRVEMEPSPYRMDTWLLRRKPGTPIRPNRFLVDYFEEEYGIHLDKAFEDLLSGKPFLAAGELSAFCNKISVQLDIPGNTSGYAIIPALGEEERKEMDTTPMIRFSGTLGLYGQDHLALAHRIRSAIAHADGQPLLMNDAEGQDFTHPFGLVEVDPCQKNVGEQVAKQSLTIAEGGTGTGKTHTAIHLASNALANGKTCLVVSPHLASMERIQQVFEDNGLGDIIYLFKDSDTDLASCHQAVKQLAQQKDKTDSDQLLSFKILMERLLARHDNLQRQHRLLSQPAFGSHGFTDTVGHYIHSNRHAGKDILAGRLDVSDYKFTFREYDMLKTDLVKGQRLFAEVHRLDHPLQALHEDLFTKQSMEKGKVAIHKQVGYYKAKCETLLSRFSKGMDSYKDRLREHYEDYSYDLQRRVDDIQDKITEYAQVFGEDFKRAGNTKVRMYGVFSDTYYNIKEAKKKVNEDYGDLVELYESQPYFPYAFADKREADTMLNIQKHLVDFEMALRDWTQGIPLAVKQSSKGLNSQSVQIHLDYKSQVGDLEYAHDLLLEELNQAKLFWEWFAYDGMTLAKRKESLERLYQLLLVIERNMESYPHFHPWQKHWLEMLPVSKETTKALVASHAKDWVAAFNSWYFYNCLSERSFLSYRMEDKHKAAFIKELSQFRTLLPPQIQATWARHRSQVFEQLRRKDRRLHQIMTQKKGQLPPYTRLRDLFRTCGRELPACFPLMMMTPEMAEELLVHNHITFDMVVFDDAHLIPTLLAVPLTDMAERCVALGDRHQSLRQDGDHCLLETFIEAGANSLPLYYQHIDKEKYSESFIDETSYKRSIKHINYSSHADYPYRGIFLHHSENSRYDEEQRLNKIEAENLASILAEGLPGKPDGGVPRTAIVTNTFPQRDYIGSYLLYIQQKRSPYYDKIQKLQEAGLRVLHVSELKDCFETIVWSPAYGSINLRGHISQQLAEMEGGFGQAALNTILGHTTNALVVCSSIPEKLVNDRIRKDLHACGPMVKFLKYAGLVQNKDEQGRREFLGKIAWEGIRQPMPLSHSFIDQVKKELSPYFESDRISDESPLDEVGTAALTLKPLNPKRTIPLIIGDALDRKMPTLAVEFEHKAIERLKESGYQVFRTHSLDWWKNPKKEARTLASRLIKSDNMTLAPERLDVDAEP